MASLVFVLFSASRTGLVRLIRSACLFVYISSSSSPRHQRRPSGGATNYLRFSGISRADSAAVRVVSVFHCGSRDSRCVHVPVAPLCPLSVRLLPFKIPKLFGAIFLASFHSSLCSGTFSRNGDRKPFAKRIIEKKIFLHLCYRDYFCLSRSPTQPEELELTCFYLSS